ncbi:alpha/beta hydrolase [Verticiella sediminum]|uniref:Alpha/beta hydrolase n=1 Tax=Verticiella sediminum TaxID=1247510 RepID=A0A556AXF4_9BURK|nr:alpha/beta fold hydrolase [Verticiella sediminum]TSH97115.1 alpha/beta hydrolase [Verticiella sediminum]
MSQRDFTALPLCASSSGQRVDTWLGDVRIVGVRQARAQAPAVLMVHGGGQAGWAFETWVEHYAKRGWHAFAVSLRGHEAGRALPDEVYCRLHLDDYRDDVVAAAGLLPAGRLVLIGHSLGGIVCQRAAEQLPLAGLVLLASAGPPELGVRRTLLDPDTPVVRTAEEARRRYFHSADEAVIERALARLVPESPGALNASGGRTPVDRARIRCPVLVLGGACDRTDVPRAMDLAALYGASAIELADTGHNIMQERMSGFAADCIHAWCEAQGIVRA